MVLVVKCLICDKELTYSQGDPSELVLHIRSEHPTISQKKKKLDLNQQERENFHKDLEVSLESNSRVLYRASDKSVQTDFDFHQIFNMSQDNKLPSSKDSTRRKKLSKLSNLSKESTQNEETKLLKNSGEDQRVSDASNSSGDYYDVTRSSNVLKPKESTPLKTPKEYQRYNEIPNTSNSAKHSKFYKTSIERWRPIGDQKILCPRCKSYQRPTVRTQNSHISASHVASSFVMACWPLCFSPCYFPEPKYENLQCPLCNFHFGVYDHQKNIVVSNPNLMRE